MIPTDIHWNSSFLGLLKSSSCGADSFLFFCGSGLPPGPSCSGSEVLVLSLRAVYMLRAVKAIMYRHSSTIG